MNKILIIFTMIFSVVIISCGGNNQNKEKQMVEENVDKGLVHPEWSKHANIYEVNIRQYTPEGTINAFDQHIDRLAEMGVDILWLMPISPIGEKNRKGGLGSYYSIQDYVAVNPEFGTLEDLQNMVKHAHENGMYVILDWVANHTAWDHTWVTEHPDFYEKDSTGAMIAPYDWTDVAQLDFDNRDVWNAQADAMIFWMKEAGIDGFRCDVAYMVPTPFWDSVRIELEKIKPDVFMLAEAEVPEHHERAFDMSYAWEVHHKMTDVSQGKEPATTLIDRLFEDAEKFKNNDYRMRFTTNHDENSWNGTEYEKMGEAYKIMAAMTFTLPGMPLIYSGQEAANKDRLRFFEKDTINFDEVPLHDFYKQLIEIKDQNQALWNGDFGGTFKVIETDDAERVIAFAREKDGNKVIFIANISADAKEVSVKFKEDAGTYQDAYLENEVIFEEENPFKLDPWQYNIFVQNQ